MRSCWLALSFFAILSTRSPRASGATPPEDRALAETLFRDGRRLLLAEQFAQACRKLEESERLDPAGGTILNLGVCHAREGRLASAWGELDEAIVIAKREHRDDRVEIAEAERASLEGRLDHVTIVVPATARTEGLEVTLDGRPIAEAAWSTSIPIDPGHRRIVATAPGRLAWEGSIEVGAERDDRTVIVPDLSPAPHARDGSIERRIGWSALAAGGSALGVGLGVFVSANNLHDQAVALAAARDPSTSMRDDEAESRLRVARIVVGAGLVVGIAGAALVVVAPSGQSSSLRLSPNVEIFEGRDGRRAAAFGIAGSF